LAWPWLRGVPWLRVRGDVGLGRGRRPFLEVLSGLGWYAAAAPMVVLGVVLMKVLQVLQERLAPAGAAGTAHTPSHPAVEWVARGDWGLRLQVLLAACVVAPLVEEIMFRGVLYRHLREATGRLG